MNAILLDAFMIGLLFSKISGGIFVNNNTYVLKPNLLKVCYFLLVSFIPFSLLFNSLSWRMIIVCGRVLMLCHGRCYTILGKTCNKGV